MVKLSLPLDSKMNSTALGSPPSTYRLNQLATAILRDREVNFAVNNYATFETVGTEQVQEQCASERTARYCFPFHCGAGRFITDQEIADRAKPTLNKVNCVRVMLLITRIRESLGRWGPNVQQARGSGHEQLEQAVIDRLRFLDDNKIGASLNVIASPKRAAILKTDLLGRLVLKKDDGSQRPAYIVTEPAAGELLNRETGVLETQNAWPDDLVVVACCGPRTTEYNTLRFVHLRHDSGEIDRLAVETKVNADGTHGRIVEDFRITDPNLKVAFALTW